MGTISPWSLLMCLLVISIAVMVHSAEDVSMNEDNDHQLRGRFRDEDDKFMPLERRSSLGSFRISVRVGKQVQQAGSWGKIYLKAEFASKNQWSSSVLLGKDMWGDTTYNSTTTDLYCGAGDHVAKVYLCNDNNDDGFVPYYIYIYGPDSDRCGYDLCNWKSQCFKWVGVGYWFDKRCLIYGCSPAKEITCEHKGPKCSSKKTCP